MKFELINPTKKIVRIKGATTPFFSAMSESFHPQWQLKMNNEKVNGFLNAWYVDTARLCQVESQKSIKSESACVLNADGNYNLEMVIEFTPQRWFYLGLLISRMTLFGCLGYLGWDWRRRRRVRKVKKSK